ncbi:hypothetical protein PcaKH15_27600 [Parageobacillus caldoxylosilyticus]|nr:hypothetical protein PcaKH15_27600 [Parageobacillus caldoxylosilyticus]BDG40643.1 hypothetical protein PcaKH16_27820 [Parageobacillus caldoxylosilyticus]BDG44393.1 hypothetical protein PcaKH35_27380 [Parageobacillus caldoxylosilyticus]
MRVILLIHINEMKVKKTTRNDRNKKEAPFADEEKQDIKNEKQPSNSRPRIGSRYGKNSGYSYINNIPPHVCAPFYA